MLNASDDLNAYSITHGYRLQNSNLPAITFEITNNERSAVSGHWLASAQIKVVAVETGTALNIASNVPAACVPASYLFGSYTFDAVMKCDPDIKKELFRNIVMAGGSTMFKGMQKRMKKEI